MVRRSSRAVPTYSELFSIALRAAIMRSTSTSNEFAGLGSCKLRLGVRLSIIEKTPSVNLVNAEIITSRPKC